MFYWLVCTIKNKQRFFNEANFSSVTVNCHLTKNERRVSLLNDINTENSFHKSLYLI